MNLRDDKYRLLVRLRAVHEAPWSPNRNWKTAGAVYQRRVGNVRLSVGGGDARRRQEISRQRDSLVADGLLVGDTLTDDGRRLARELSYWFTKPELRLAMKRLKGCLDRGDVLDCTHAGFVPEYLIAGQVWGQQIEALQQMVAPLLADQLLQAETDSVGTCYYRLAQPWPVVSKAAERVIVRGERFDEKLAKVFRDEYLHCRETMLADSTTYLELGCLGLPLEGLVSGREAFCTDGIRPLFPGLPSAEVLPKNPNPSFGAAAGEGANG
ncbi:MAG: hypothetical protein U0805_13515 [Pirellulales bacterium]